MAKLICPKCKYLNVIEFKIEGFGLEEMVINFRCHKCKYPGALNIKFKGEKTEQKVRWADTSYIG